MAPSVCENGVSVAKTGYVTCLGKLAQKGGNVNIQFTM